jgi:hypothetical protein
MKDTAVKFLIDEISCRFIISEELRIAMYKAKEMEKEQMLDIYINHNQYNDNFLGFDDYYNENFKSE